MLMISLLNLLKSSMIEEGKYCTDIMKKHFNKKPIMTKEHDEDFENSSNIGSVLMLMLMVMLK